VITSDPPPSVQPSHDVAVAQNQYVCPTLPEKVAELLPELACQLWRTPSWVT